MPNLTVSELIDLAIQNQGRELQTLAQGKPFRVEVEHTARGNVNVVFTPMSTPDRKSRKATNQKRLQAIVEIYNKTGSLRNVDYKPTGSRNMSYILALMALSG